ASTGKRRTKIVHQNDTTDRMRSLLSALRVLQDDQLKAAQKKLAQAGIRSKEWAIAIIFGRLVLPIVVGGTAALLIYGFDLWPDWSALKKFGVFAGALLLSYKAPDIYVDNMVSKRATEIRKGIPDALDLLVICAEAGLTVDA